METIDTAAYSAIRFAEGVRWAVGPKGAIAKVPT